MRILLLITCLLLVSCASQTPRPPVGTEFPDDVMRFIEHREGCEHFIGEEPYDADRQAFLEQSINERCSGIDARLDNLRSKYVDDPEILKRLAGYEAIE